MRKALLFAPMIALCLLLVGCGGKSEEAESRDVQERYRAMTAASAEAELICHYGGEVRTYGLSCAYTPESTAVTVTEPAELAGVSAVFDAETLTLAYDDVLLDAGIYSGTRLSPFWAVPSMLQTIGEGYLLEYCEEDVGEDKCLRACFEVTEEDGEKTLYTVWFDGEENPVRGEIAVEGEVVYAVTFRSFTAETDGTEQSTKEEPKDGTDAEADLGGD